MHGTKSTNTTFCYGCFGTTCYDCIGFSQTDKVECIGNGVAWCCTCRCSCIVRTMETIKDRDLTSCNVRNHFRDEERIEFWTILLVHCIVANFFFEGSDTSDTSTENNSNTILVNRFTIQTSIAYGLLGHCYSVLCVKVHLSGLFTINIFCCIEAFYFACELCLEKGCVKMSNRSRSTSSINKSVPIILYVVADGCNGAETCYYHSF